MPRPPPPRPTTPFEPSPGHHSSSQTPIKSIPMVTQANEEANKVDEQIEIELHDKVYLLNPDDFIKFLMYREDSTEYEIDRTVAKDCFESLKIKATACRIPVLEEMARQEGTSDSDIEPLLPTYTNQSFFKLRNGIREEKDLYPPLVILLTYINTFFRLNFNATIGKSPIDAAWPSAVDPLATPQDSTTQPVEEHFRRRRFVITAETVGSFIHLRDCKPRLLPDLCLLLEPTITSAPCNSEALPGPGTGSSTSTDLATQVQHAGGSMKTRSKSRAETASNPTTGGSEESSEPATGSKKTIGQLLPAKNSTKTSVVQLYWKDVKVPIEVKLDSSLNCHNVCQMARYARAARLEQFDRNVVFSILLNKEECHVFHWDPAACFITTIHIHKEPAKFVQVVGRLASMSPHSMGYDLQFSNAGRVLASERLRTLLQVVSSPATPFIDVPRPTLKDQKTVIQLDLDVDKPLAATRGFLFSRFVRVWRAKVVKDSDPESWPMCVVKQNWADMSRLHEAFLCEKAKNVENVATVLGSEVAACTPQYRQGIKSNHFLGVYRRPQPPSQASDEQPDTTELTRDKDEDSQADDDDFNNIPGPRYDHYADNIPMPSTNASSTKKLPFQFEPASDVEKLCIVDRAVVRMIFSEIGRSLWMAKNSTELLKATRDWVKGVEGLWRENIVHRDISTGNLLLGASSDDPAFLIDLGLAHKGDIPPGPDQEAGEDLGRRHNSNPSDQDSDAANADVLRANNPEKLETPGQRDTAQKSADASEEQMRMARDHHHITGTLPFISYEILEGNISGPIIPSTYHHDIESIFWVLVYFCLTKSTDPQAIQALEFLNDSKVPAVLLIKKDLLTGRLKKLKFPWQVEPVVWFLRELAPVFWNGGKRCEPVEFDVVYDIIDRALEEASKRAPKRKLSNVKIASPETVTEAQLQDDLGEGSDREGRRRRLE
ncbi:hypothetical protein FRB90_010255 [Tulasnella sp. 427]|nr:hypothetical protein FRB90_010255 [Tulasnella sp. 427]